VVLIENRKGEMVVRREVKYVYGFQAEIDRLYGWGLQWGRGYKSKV
jgi:tellurite resistance protein TerA